MNNSGLANGFLESAYEHSDTMFRMPPRKNCSVHPIIDSEDTFKLMEEAISLAKSYIYMAYWDLQTDLKTMSSDLRRRGINNWTDLLIDAAKRGVTVRILLNDFDPDFSHNFHHDSWKSYNRLMVKSEEARIIYRADMSRFQVICSMHEAKLPPDNLMLLLLTSAERSIMESEINEIASRHGLTAALSVIRNMPRIWDIIERDKSGKFRIEKFRPRPVHVASHHQKICLIDGEIAFLGGIDPKQEVQDNKKHEKPPFRHDIQCLIRGLAVLDIERNFVGLWNYYIADFKNFVTSINKHNIGHSLVIGQITPIRDFHYKISNMKGGDEMVQILRTITGRIVEEPISGQSGKVYHPELIRNDIEESYKKLISSAEQYIYIENQYLRWPEVGEWIIDRYRKKKSLQVIIVIPITPEEAFRLPGQLDEVTLHGLHLQHELLTKLRKDMPNNVGLFTLVANSWAPNNNAATPEFHHSPSIYVHSKVCIIDDSFSIIGSANLNGRSLRVDDEICIGWFHPSKVKSFRTTLWKELLGVSAIELENTRPYSYLALWNMIAGYNSIARPGTRRGFIVPYDINKSKKGRRSNLIQDIYAKADIHKKDVTVMAYRKSQKSSSSVA